MPSPSPLMTGRSRVFRSCGSCSCRTRQHGFAPTAMFIGGDTNVPEVDNRCAGDADQSDKIATTQEEYVLEYVVWKREFLGAVAVVPGHVGQVQQIKHGLDIAV